MSHTAEYYRAWNAAHREQKRAAHKRYRQTEWGKHVHRMETARWRRSPKGIAMEYRRRLGGKPSAAIFRWWHSPKGLAYLHKRNIKRREERARTKEVSQ